MKTEAKVIWGYWTYPFGGRQGEDTRFGAVPVDMPTTVAALKAKATRLVKSSEALHHLFLKYINDWDRERFADATGTEIHSPEKLWEYVGPGIGGEWTVWQKPEPLKDSPHLLVTARWKWVDRRDWHRSYSIDAAGEPLPEVPDVRAYYGCVYPAADAQ